MWNVTVKKELSFRKIGGTHVTTNLFSWTLANLSSQFKMRCGYMFPLTKTNLLWHKDTVNMPSLQRRQNLKVRNYWSIKTIFEGSVPLKTGEVSTRGVLPLRGFSVSALIVFAYLDWLGGREKAGEVTQLLRALAVLVKDPGLLLSIHMVAPKHLSVSNSKATDILFRPLWEPSTHLMHTRACRQKSHTCK